MKLQVLFVSSRSNDDSIISANINVEFNGSDRNDFDSIDTKLILMIDKMVYFFYCDFKH